MMLKLCWTLQLKFANSSGKLTGLTCNFYKKNWTGLPAPKQVYKDFNLYIWHQCYKTLCDKSDLLMGYSNVLEWVQPSAWMFWWCVYVGHP